MMCPSFTFIENILAVDRNFLWAADPSVRMSVCPHPPPAPLGFRAPAPKPLAPSLCEPPFQDPTKPQLTTDDILPFESAALL